MMKPRVLIPLHVLGSILFLAATYDLKYVFCFVVQLVLFNTFALFYFVKKYSKEKKQKEESI